MQAQAGRALGPPPVPRISLHRQSQYNQGSSPQLFRLDLLCSEVLTQAQAFQGRAPGHTGKRGETIAKTLKVRSYCEHACACRASLGVCWGRVGGRGIPEGFES